MTFPARGRTTTSRVLVGVVTLLALVAVVALPATADAAQSVVAKTVTGVVAAESPVPATASMRVGHAPAVVAHQLAEQVSLPDDLSLVTHVSSAGRVPAPVSLKLLLVTLAFALVLALLRVTGVPLELLRPVGRTPRPPSRSTRPRVPRGPPALRSIQARRRPVPREVDRPSAGPCFGGLSCSNSSIAPTIQLFISTSSTNGACR